MANTLNTFEDFIRLKRTNTESFYSLAIQRSLYLRQKYNPNFFNHTINLWRKKFGHKGLNS